jgi:hypothetical protein
MRPELLSVSMERARRADTPSAAKTAIVKTSVFRGWCQNSHTIVSADSARTAKKTKRFVRECDECVIASHLLDANPVPQVALYMFSKKTPMLQLFVNGGQGHQSGANGTNRKQMAKKASAVPGEEIRAYAEPLERYEAKDENERREADRERQREVCRWRESFRPTSVLRDTGKLSSVSSNSDAKSPLHNEQIDQHIVEVCVAHSVGNRAIWRAALSS